MYYLLIMVGKEYYALKSGKLLIWQCCSTLLFEEEKRIQERTFFIKFFIIIRDGISFNDDFLEVCGISATRVVYPKFGHPA